MFYNPCRKYFCKYVESHEVDGSPWQRQADDLLMTIMCRRGLFGSDGEIWLCNLCTFATRMIKVLFSYFTLV